MCEGRSPVVTNLQFIRASYSPYGVFSGSVWGEGGAVSELLLVQFSGLFAREEKTEGRKWTATHMRDMWDGVSLGDASRGVTRAVIREFRIS